MNKLIHTMLAIMTVAGTFLPVHAEGDIPQETTSTVASVEHMPVIAGKLGNLTVRYFDDEEETLPVAGAEFTVYQISSIGTDFSTNGAYVPVDSSLELTNVKDEDIVEFEGKVLDAYKKNPDAGYRKTLSIGEKGTARFTDMPAGAYLVTETKTVRYHIRPKSFVVSVPETNESGTDWNFDVVCNPKQITAGDLEVTKTVHGKLSKKDASFTVVLNLPAGEYSAKLPDGTESKVKDKDEICIKKDQTLYIYDLPAGAKYEVTEKEADQSIDKIRFKTNYQKNKGTITEKASTKVSIVNDSSPFDTGAGNQMLYYLIGGGVAFTLLVFLTAAKKKKD